jgi:hypothetical protein
VACQPRAAANPLIMSSPVYDPNQASIGNALAGAEYGYTNAPLIQDPASFAIAPTGEQMDLEFLNEPFNEGWDDTKKMLWEQKWVAGISPTPASAAADAKAFLADERKRAAEASKMEPGKRMTSTEVSDLTQLGSVEYSLELLEQRLAQVPENERGPVFGKVRGANPYDVQAQEVQNIITSIVPGLARGVFNEVGVLTEPDVQRYTRLLPTLATPPELARRNIENLREKLKDSKIKRIETMRKAGMDVSGFEEDYSRLMQEREAKEQAAQQQQAQQQAQQQQQAPLPGAIGGYILKTPRDPDFDPNENNGNPYYEER